MLSCCRRDHEVVCAVCRPYWGSGAEVETAIIVTWLNTWMSWICASLCFLSHCIVGGPTTQRFFREFLAEVKNLLSWRPMQYLWQWGVVSSLMLTFNSGGLEPEWRIVGLFQSLQFCQYASAPVFPMSCFFFKAFLTALSSLYLLKEDQINSNINYICKPLKTTPQHSHSILCLAG